MYVYIYIHTYRVNPRLDNPPLYKYIFMYIYIYICIYMYIYIHTHTHRVNPKLDTPPPQTRLHAPPLQAPRSSGT